MQNIQAAIFDLDGTILDSMGVWSRIDEQFLARRGFAVPPDYAAAIAGRSFVETALYTITRFGLPDSADDLMREWSAMAADEYAHHVCLVPHAADYLRRLYAAGIRLAIATALTETLYRPCLENNGVYELFDVFCSTDEVGCGKSQPDVFLLAAKRLCVPPAQCLVFEDILPAVLSAKAAGMYVCGVYEPFSAHHRPAIEQAADQYITGFAEAPLLR